MTTAVERMLALAADLEPGQPDLDAVHDMLRHECPWYELVDKGAVGDPETHCQPAGKMTAGWQDRGEELMRGELTNVSLTPRTAEASTVHKPLGKKGLWGMKGAQLPAYIQHVAHHLIGKYGRSRAIGMAVGIVKNWAHGHTGRGHKVHADVQAAAGKNIAEWERLRAKRHALTAAKAAKRGASRDNESRSTNSALDRLLALAAPRGWPQGPPQAGSMLPPAATAPGARPMSYGRLARTPSQTTAASPPLPPGEGMPDPKEIMSLSRDVRAAGDHEQLKSAARHLEAAATAITHKGGIGDIVLRLRAAQTGINAAHLEENLRHLPQANVFSSSLNPAAQSSARAEMAETLATRRTYRELAQRVAKHIDTIRRTFFHGQFPPGYPSGWGTSAGDIGLTQGNQHANLELAAKWVKPYWRKGEHGMEQVGGYQRFFHGSPSVFHVGELVEPGHPPVHLVDKSAPAKHVYTTTDLARARLFSGAVEPGPWHPGGQAGHVYEVEPTGEVLKDVHDTWSKTSFMSSDPWRVVREVPDTEEAKPAAAPAPPVVPKVAEAPSNEELAEHLGYVVTPEGEWVSKGAQAAGGTKYWSGDWHGGKTYTPKPSPPPRPAIPEPEPEHGEGLKPQSTWWAFTPTEGKVSKHGKAEGTLTQYEGPRYMMGPKVHVSAPNADDPSKWEHATLFGDEAVKAVDAGVAQGEYGEHNGNFLDSEGNNHWGWWGAAGLLVSAPDENGETRYLLQKRAYGVQMGGTWSTPGGAIDRDHGVTETPVEAAIREGEEEFGSDLPEGTHHVRTYDATFGKGKGAWTYHTVVMHAPAVFDPHGKGVKGVHGTSWESAGYKWVTPEEMADLPLHPGFHATAVKLGMDPKGGLKKPEAPPPIKTNPLKPQDYRKGDRVTWLYKGKVIHGKILGDPKGFTYSEKDKKLPWGYRAKADNGPEVEVAWGQLQLEPPKGTAPAKGKTKSSHMSHAEMVALQQKINAAERGHGHKPSYGLGVPTPAPEPGVFKRDDRVSFQGNPGTVMAVGTAAHIIKMDSGQVVTVPAGSHDLKRKVGEIPGSKPKAQVKSSGKPKFKLGQMVRIKSAQTGITGTIVRQHPGSGDWVVMVGKNTHNVPEWNLDYA